MDRRTPENYQAIIASLEAEVERLTTALNLIDEARAKAVAEVARLRSMLVDVLEWDDTETLRDKTGLSYNRIAEILAAAGK